MPSALDRQAAARDGKPGQRVAVAFQSSDRELLQPDHRRRATAPSIVSTVTAPNTTVTSTTQVQWCSQAGAIIKGKSASHGPRANRMNSDHTVRSALASSGWWLWPWRRPRNRAHAM